MADPLPSFVCQQCKQPIQLDPSVIEATPEAAQETLPVPSHRRKSSSTKGNALTPAQRLAILNASPTAKSAWEAANFRVNKDDIRLSPATASSNGTGAGHRRRTSSTGGIKTASTTAGAESFVLLPDNAAGRIPKSGTSPRTPTNGGGNPPPSNSARRISASGRATPSPSSKTTSTTSGPSSSTATTSPTPTQPPSTPPLPTPTSNNLHATMRLFTLLSSHSELDHPLCADCTNTLTENLERKLEETRRERDGYIAFEKEVKKSRESITASGLDEKKLEHKIQRLEQESLRAIADLRAAEQERIALEAEIAAIKEEEDALEEEEIAFWTERSRTQLQQTRAKDQLASITAALSSTQREIASLSRTNVYNDAFCIGHDGMFGTINGLRLGRSTSAGGNVEWAEINAAWGQALLLLYTIARKVEFTFDTYRLVPMGSFSKIERISGDRGTYELYGSGDLNLTRMLHNRRFDHAMIAFLECLRQLMDHVRARDPSIDFPHLVVKDKIGDVSIKLQFNNEEVWTKAMRHVLLALKILLRWATSG